MGVGSAGGAVRGTIFSQADALLYRFMPSGFNAIEQFTPII